MQDDWIFSSTSKLSKFLLLIWHWVSSFKLLRCLNRMGWFYWNHFLNQQCFIWLLVTFLYRNIHSKFLSFYKLLKWINDEREVNLLLKWETIPLKKCVCMCMHSLVCGSYKSIKWQIHFLRVKDGYNTRAITIANIHFCILENNLTYKNLVKLVLSSFYR